MQKVPPTGVSQKIKPYNPLNREDLKVIRQLVRSQIGETSAYIGGLDSKDTYNKKYLKEARDRKNHLYKILSKLKQHD